MLEKPGAHHCLSSQESGSSSVELSSKLLLPDVFLKYLHHKRPKLTVIPNEDEVNAAHFDFDRCITGITVTAKQA